MKSFPNIYHAYCHYPHILLSLVLEIVAVSLRRFLVLQNYMRISPGCAQSSLLILSSNSFQREMFVPYVPLFEIVENIFQSKNKILQSSTLATALL